MRTINFTSNKPAERKTNLLLAICAYCCVWDHMDEFIFSWVHYWVSLRLLWGSQTARLGKDHAVPEAESGFLPVLWRRAVEHTCLHTHLSHTQRACRMGSLCCCGAMSLCWQHFSPSKTKSNTTPAAPAHSVCLFGQAKKGSGVRENRAVLKHFTSNCLLCQNGSCD